MQSESQQLLPTSVPAVSAADPERRSLIRRRSTLEARLLAHRCGWCPLDDIRLRRLERSLGSVLEALGGTDPAADLIRHR